MYDRFGFKTVIITLFAFMLGITFMTLAGWYVGASNFNIEIEKVDTENYESCLRIQDALIVKNEICEQDLAKDREFTCNCPGSTFTIFMIAFYFGIGALAGIFAYHHGRNYYEKRNKEKKKKS